MDYVVFGTGYGATLMVLGWALRTFGPALRYQDSDGDTPQRADMMMARLSWRRFASALGAVIATAGIALTLVTFIVILINPGDYVGSWVAWICFALILLAVAVWAWLYVERYGIYGILPERQEPSTVFSSRMPARPTPQSAVARQDAVPVSVPGNHDAEPAGPDDIEIILEPEPDHGEVDVWDEDELHDDEQEARYAKYQLHHPDVQESVPTVYDDILDDETVEHVSPGEEVTPATEEPEAAGDDAIGQGDVAVESELEAAAGGEESPDEPLVEDEPEAITALDEAATIEDVQESESPDRDVELPEPEAGETGTNPMPPLSDTPEGRAEALRRIQEWQPQKPDDES